MMTEMEKWHELYDDEAYIELLIQEGHTPESSSGMSTEDIERERDLRLYREEKWNSSYDSVEIFTKSMAVVGAVVGVGYLGYKLVKKGCYKVKEVISNHKHKKEVES